MGTFITQKKVAEEREKGGLFDHESMGMRRGDGKVCLWHGSNAFKCVARKACYGIWATGGHDFGFETVFKHYALWDVQFTGQSRGIGHGASTLYPYHSSPLGPRLTHSVGGQYSSP